MAEGTPQGGASRRNGRLDYERSALPRCLSIAEGSCNSQRIALNGVLHQRDRSPSWSIAAAQGLLPGHIPNPIGHNSTLVRIFRGCCRASSRYRWNAGRRGLEEARECDRITQSASDPDNVMAF